MYFLVISVFTFLCALEAPAKVNTKALPLPPPPPTPTPPPPPPPYQALVSTHLHPGHYR